MADRPAAPPAPPLPTGGAKKSPKATLPKALALSITSGIEDAPKRNVIYGTGGIGKSTLAAFLPAPIFIDLERGTREIAVSRDRTVTTWSELRGKLAGIAASPPKGARSVVIDTATEAQELDCQHVIETRLTEKGKSVDSIEGFGWGKGWHFAYDEFNGLLADLDRVTDAGLIVCMTAHVVSSVVPNPEGEDFLRWEPNLYAGDKKGRSSIRERVKNWADNLLFIGYDVNVSDGKGQGSGTRSIYTAEMPTHMAKSRSKALSISFNLEDPGAVWRELGIQ